MTTGRSRNPGKPNRRKPRRRDPYDDSVPDGADDVASDESADGTDAIPSAPLLETRKLKDLKPFPLQHEFFDEDIAVEIETLAKEIEEDGLIEPIEIVPETDDGLPADTIISGHRRRLACESIGLTKVKVKVRYDLVHAGRSTIEQIYFRKNLHRRHLDRLTRARITLRLYELELGRERGDFDEDQAADARDRVGQTIGMSGRNLERYWNVIRTPVPVQNAFRDGRLTLVAAAKVAKLDTRQQQRIARRIKKGEEPKTVLAEYFPKSERRQPKPNLIVTGLTRALRRAIDDMAGREDEVDAEVVSEVKRELKQGRGLIRRLLALLAVDPPGGRRE